jgi:hypothetical protein
MVVSGMSIRKSGGGHVSPMDTHSGFKALFFLNLIMVMVDLKKSVPCRIYIVGIAKKKY